MNGAEGPETTSNRKQKLFQCSDFRCGRENIENTAENPEWKREFEPGNAAQNGNKYRRRNKVGDVVRLHGGLNSPGLRSGTDDQRCGRGLTLGAFSRSDSGSLAMYAAPN